VRIAAAAEADSAWAAVGRQESVLEAFVDFEREVSVVAARVSTEGGGLRGDRERPPPPHPRSVHGAAAVPSAVAAEAVRLTRAVLEALDVVGVLCVEFFLTHDGRC